MKKFSVKELQDGKLEKISNTSYATDKRIIERNIRRVKECKSEQRLTELLSTGNRNTIAMILSQMHIRGNFQAREKSKFVKLCANAIFENNKLMHEVFSMFKTANAEDEIMEFLHKFSDEQIYEIYEVHSGQSVGCYVRDPYFYKKLIAQRVMTEKEKGYFNDYYKRFF